MSTLTVLAVGVTGSIDRQVVADALAAGHHVRALARNRERARELPAEAEIVIGDVTAPHTLAAAVAGIDALDTGVRGGPDPDATNDRYFQLAIPEE